MNPNEDILRKAIQNRQPVYAVYQGRERWLCPHVLGHKGGKLHVLGYQYAGDSSRGRIATPPDPQNGPPAYWRCMDVDELSQLSLQEPGPWYSCPRHTQRQTCVDHVLVEVANWPKA